MKKKLEYAVLAVALLACSNTVKGEQEANVEKREQVITELTSSDSAQLEKQRKVIEAYLGNEDLQKKYETSAGKLRFLRALLDQKVFKPEQTYRLQCMGIVLGDAFVKELGLRWVMVEDDQGRNPAVRYGNSSIIVFPLTMISKRIEKGEEVDVFDLFNGVAEWVEEIKRKAD